MTTQERLEERLMLLIDLGAIIDRSNDMLIVVYNRRLDMPLTFLKHLSKARFTSFLDSVAEAFTKYNKVS